MKNSLIVVLALTSILGINMVFATDEKIPDAKPAQQASVIDTRTSLNMTDKMKQRQLSNMRVLLGATKIIVGLMAENKFDEAAKIARAKLGPPAKKHKKFGDEGFLALRKAFRKSGNDLGDALQTKDVNASLSALNKTMQYCVACHATYRQ